MIIFVYKYLYLLTSCVNTNVEPTSPIQAVSFNSFLTCSLFFNQKNYQIMEKKIIKSAIRCGIGKN